MTLKIDLPNGVDLVDAVAAAAEILRDQGFEVNDNRKGWRVIMFRKSERAWTQAYTGLTARAKVGRYWLKVDGPEEEYFPLTWR